MEVQVHWYYQEMNNQSWKLTPTKAWLPIRSIAGKIPLSTKDQTNISREEKLKEDQINIISTQSVHPKFQEKTLQENNDNMKFEWVRKSSLPRIVASFSKQAMMYLIL
jgi:hypothetical protein